MKVRVADVCSSELRWEFGLPETEKVTPATILMPAANKGDPNLKNAKPGATNFLQISNHTA